MPHNKIRVYDLEVIADGYSYYQEGRIKPRDSDPGVNVARICRKLIDAWAAGEFEDRREIVIRFISSKQKV